MSELSPPASSPLVINEVTKDFIAGTFAGMAGVLVGHPFDTVKIRMQSSHSNYGTFNTIKHLIGKEGVQGLYKGMASPLFSVGFINALLFSSYGFILRNICENEEAVQCPSPMQAGFAGSVGGIVNSFICSPIELIKTKLQVQTDSGKTRDYKGPLQVAQKIVRLQGYRGLFTGLNATIMREAPGYCAYFSTFEIFRQRLAHTPEERDSVQPWKLMVAGGFSGLAAWIISYPVDVVKTRLQAQSFRNKEYSGIFNCFAKSYREEGYRVFLKGLTPTLLRAVPTNAAIFLCYELIMRSWT